MFIFTYFIRVLLHECQILKVTGYLKYRFLSIHCSLSPVNLVVISFSFVLPSLSLFSNWFFSPLTGVLFSCNNFMACADVQGCGLSSSTFVTIVSISDFVTCSTFFMISFLKDENSNFPNGLRESKL